MRALIVDDSRAMRAILGRILREAHFEVLEASHGREALELLRKRHPLQPFELALVDWNMPEMSGYELVRAVRADDAFRDLRIVMVTTENEIEKIARALEAGADEYAMKPFTKEVILEKLAILGLVVP